MQNACCLVLCLLCAFWHAALFGFFVRALGRTCCLSSCDVVCMCILHSLIVHSVAYFMHAQRCLQVGMQHTLACLCLLAFYIYVVLHAMVIHVWAYLMHARGMQNRHCVCLHFACILLKCWSILGKDSCKMCAVLFRAFCVQFGMPFCLGCCLHMCLACIGYAYLGILHAEPMHAKQHICKMLANTITQVYAPPLPSRHNTASPARKWLAFCMPLAIILQHFGQTPTSCMHKACKLRCCACLLFACM